VKYLTLAPDYTRSCIKDEFSEIIEIKSLSLPDDFKTQLEDWHIEYRKIIPLDEAERIKKSQLIDKLDKVGISLTKQLSMLIEGGAKIKYFSEGHLKYLPID